MKKIISLIIAVLLLFLTACSRKNETVVVTPTATPTVEKTKEAIQTDGLETNENADKLSNYTVDVTLVPEEKKLTVKENIDYLNPSQEDLSEVYFNIVCDYFKNEGGGVTVNKVLFDENDSELVNVKGTVFKAAPAAALGAGKRTNITFEYEVKIPEIQNRFGYQDGYFNLGNFLITPAVFKEGEYAVLPYVDLGDAFYTDVANFNVKINVPDEYKIAACGSLNKDGVYHINNARDFAFCASDKYDVLEDNSGGVAIKVYSGGELKLAAKRALQVAKNSLELFSEKFGQYPYDTLSVVMNGLTSGVGGMEYPTLIMVSPEISADELSKMGMDFENDLDAVIALFSQDKSVSHEVAHQWFYGIVGNDQINEPWLDEGFCRFCEFLYQKAYPPSQIEDIEAYETETYLKFNVQSVTGKGDSDMDFLPDETDLTKSLYEWGEGNAADYSGIYEKGAGLIYAIYENLGEEAFFAAAKEYVLKFKYDFVTTETFKEFWLSKGDLSDIIEAYFK